MLKWALMPLRRYTDFSGRSRRMEYWSYSLAILVAYLVLMLPLLLGGGIGAFMTNPEAGFGVGGIISMVLVGLLTLAVIIPSIAVAVRRLHDLNLTGWIYLGVIILSYVPILGILVSIGYLVAMFWPGTPGPNKYGPDPKSTHTADVFI